MVVEPYPPGYFSCIVTNTSCLLHNINLGLHSLLTTSYKFIFQDVSFTMICVLSSIIKWVTFMRRLATVELNPQKCSSGLNYWCKANKDFLYTMYRTNTRKRQYYTNFDTILIVFVLHISELRRSNKTYKLSNQVGKSILGDIFANMSAVCTSCGLSCINRLHYRQR